MPNDDESDSHKRSRILGKLTDYIPNAVAILSWQEEIKAHNIPQAECDSSNKRTILR